MKRKIKAPVLVANIRNVTSDLTTVNGGVLSHCVKGTSHPPKKSDAVSPLAVAMLAYSAMKNIEKLMPLYSV